MRTKINHIHINLSRITNLKQKVLNYLDKYISAFRFVLVLIFVLKHFASMYVYVLHTHTWHLWRPEEVVRSFETGVIDDYESQCRSLEQGSGLLHEK